MSPSEYIISVLSEFPDNEMTAGDLLEWQGDERRFNKVAIYNALNHLLERGKVVRTQDVAEKRTYWAIATVEKGS